MTARPEWDALLACARAAVWDRPAAPLDGAVDGDALVALADAHGMIPHLHQAYGEALAPAGARAELARRARRIALQGLHFTAELHRVADALAAADIQVIVLKGPALAAALYGAVGRRHFTDLDLLIPPAAAVRAVETLVALGYRAAPPLGHDAPARSEAAPPLPGPAEQRSAAELRVRHEVRLLHAARGVAVELHVALAPTWFGRLHDLDGCRERARPLPVGGRPVLDLADEDKVLHLAIHGSGHAWVRLQWLCDLGRLIQAGAAIRWAEVARRARRVRCERDLALGLALARDLLGVAPPIARRRDTVALALGRIATGRLRTRAGASLTRSERHVLQLALRQGLRDLACVPALLLFNASAEDLALLPERLWPYAAVFRPVSLAHRYLLRPALAAIRAGR
jgi:hypothetical protein